MIDLQGKKLYVVRYEDIPEVESVDDLTDEEFKELSNGWHFNTIEGYITSFNADANDCPVPSEHFIRLI